VKRRAVVCTHRKTGTVWMRRTFRDICAATNVAYFRLLERYDEPPDFEPPAVILAMDARWSRHVPERLRRADDRFLHLIRDPRDVIVSAAHYHRTTNETPFLVPREEFGGLTYQQAINGLPDDCARYLFEMDHDSKKTLRHMAGWNYSRPDCFELRYEDLMADAEADLFGRAAAHLGFEDDELPTVKELFLKNSLFAGTPARSDHIRSGALRQWESAYDRPLAGAFLDRFGDILIRLGYERDDSWVGALAEDVTSA
jgi:hypothetical protein